MKKILLLACLVLLAAIIGYAIVNTIEKAKQPEVEMQSVPAAGESEIIEVKETRTVSIEKEIPMNLPEEQMQFFIHAMSHQKVKAKEKWNNVPLTSERVNRLLEVARAREADYKSGSTYVEILSRWAEKDFSKVVEDHNRIWTLQNGTIGKATGILSVEEEKQFIQQHFNAK